MKYFAHFRFDDAHGLLWREGTRVPLTAKAGSLLSCLLDHAGHTVPKGVILSTVWRDTHVTPENIKVLVREIRLALGDDAREPRYIQTTRRNGYTFVAPVQDLPHGIAAPEPSAAATVVDREQERETLEAALQAAARGERSIAVITGGPGTGKSVLVGGFMRTAARAGFLVTRGSCVECSGVAEPYAPILDALHRLLGEAPRARDVVARHAPTLMEHLQPTDNAHRTALLRTPAVAAPPRLLREIVTAIEELALEMPTVLVLEDLQWTDPWTTDVLRAIGRRRNATRLLVAVTMRPLDVGGRTESLRHLLEELTITRRATRLRLSAVGRRQVEAYVEQRFGAGLVGALAQPLYRATSGHLLLLAAAADYLASEQLLTHTDDVWMLACHPGDLPGAIEAGLSGIVERQLAQVSRAERSLLAAAAGFDAEFDSRQASLASDLDPVTAEEMLDRLARRGDMIERCESATEREALPRYRFTYDGYREALRDVVGDSPPPTPVEVHYSSQLAPRAVASDSSLRRSH